MEFKAIGYVHTVYPEKFGIPRQSGLIDAPGYITFEKPFDDVNALRGLGEYDRIWLIWQASANLDASGEWEWHPTVRPPRLGGNERKGVWAARSPYHPNAIGLSCVRLTGVYPDGSEFGVDGPILAISGMDILDGTPLLDIKPYVPYADSFPDARCSFATPPDDDRLEVTLCEESVFEGLSDEDIAIIIDMVRKDPSPRYQDDPDRIYGMRFKNFNIKFSISGSTAQIISIEEQ